MTTVDHRPDEAATTPRTPPDLRTPRNERNNSDSFFDQVAAVFRWLDRNRPVVLRYATACFPLIGTAFAAGWSLMITFSPPRRNKTYWGPLLLAIVMTFVWLGVAANNGQQSSGPNTGGSNGSGNHAQEPAQPGQAVQPGINHQTPLDARLTYTDGFGDTMYTSVDDNWSNRAITNYVNYWIGTRVEGSKDLTSAYAVLENSALQLLYPQSTEAGHQMHIRPNGNWDTSSGPLRVCQCTVRSPNGTVQQVKLQLTFRARDGKPSHWTVAVL